MDRLISLKRITKRNRIQIFISILLSIAAVLLLMNFVGVISPKAQRVARNNDLTVSKSVDRLRSLQPESSPFTPVIVITYMRSGSSLTGDILQHSPGAFFLYEPLRRLSFLARDRFNLTFVNGSYRNWPYSFEEEAVNILRNWLNCNIKQLPTTSFLDGFLGKGIRNRKFRSCFSNLKHTTDESAAIDTCLPELESECETSPIRIIKTIRTPLKLISHFMEEMPGLKIIHLVRDPRATLNSQRRFGKCSLKHGGMYGCSDGLCTRLKEDHTEVEVLTKKYPGRVTTVLYEDIATKPIETSKKMFQFMGTTFTREAEEYVFNITLAGLPNNCAICTTRTNSSEHVNTWKTTLTPEFIKIIEERCHDILIQFNYSLTSNEGNG